MLLIVEYVCNVCICAEWCVYGRFLRMHCDKCNHICTDTHRYECALRIGVILRSAMYTQYPHPSTRSTRVDADRAHIPQSVQMHSPAGIDDPTRMQLILLL